jgi:mRNA interferase RelE/StbE
VRYPIRITPSALTMLKGISDRRIREKIISRIDDLAEDPEKQGKPLIEELAGYRSLRAVGQRYRIIYGVDRGLVIVIVVAIGIRKAGSQKDIYTLAKKLIRLRLVEPSKSK